MDREISQSNLIICDKCKMVPCVLLNENEKKVHMKCKCRMNEMVLTLEEFNTKYQKSHLRNTNENKLHSCNIHKLPLCCYCVTCNKYFCEDNECSLEHNNINNEHQYYNFNMYYNKVHTVMNTISNTFNNIIINTNTITENIIEGLNKEIMKIKQTYKDYMTKIKLLKTYLEILLVNYNELPGNYQMLMNLITHSLICVPKININTDSNIIYQIENAYKMFNTNIIEIKYEQQQMQFHKEGLIDNICSSTLNIDNCNKIEPFTNITVINSNNNTYEIACLSEQQNIFIYTYNSNAQTLIYDIKYNKEVFKLNIGQSYNVENIYLLSKGRIAVTYKNNSLLLWLITNKTIKYISTLHTNTHNIYYLKELNNNRIFTADYSNNLIMYSFINTTTTFECLTKKFHEHIIAITESKDMKKLFICLVDCYIIIWNIQKRQKEQTIPNVICCSEMSILDVNENYFIVGGANMLYLINKERNIVDKVIQDDRFEGINCVMLWNTNNVICGSIKGGLSVVDLEKFDCVLFYQKAHDLNVYNVISLNNKSDLKGYGEVASVSLDGFVKIWKINV